MGGVRRFTDRRCGDAVPGRADGSGVARCLLLRLHLHFHVRDLLHLSTAAHRACWKPGPAADRRGPQSSDVGGQRAIGGAALGSRPRRRIAVVMFWVAVLAISILLYILLDGFDLGIGILFGLAGSEERRRAMMSAVAPIWDGNETWLVVAGVVLWGAFP